MDKRTIAESLSPIERKTIKFLSGDFKSYEEISNESAQDKTTTLRAIKFLLRKNLLEEKSRQVKIASLGVLGIEYLKKQLPERALLNKLYEKRKIPIRDVGNICNLNQNEVRAAIGALKRKGVLKISNGILELVGASDIAAKMPEELLLEKLPKEFEDLSPDEKEIFKSLLSRKEIVQIEEKKEILVRLTGLGEKVSKMDIESNLIEKLTPKMIKTSGWKGKKFRRYDLTTPVPRIYGGKRHFVNQAADYARSIWVEMGFKEMTGNLVDTSFWVFDSLFTAQDHPVREMQDTFYIKGKFGKLPQKELVSMVRKAHENGVGGSVGWKYQWSESESRRVLLRTHTTCLSARQLVKISLEKEFPAKYFALGKCFRNETVDWSHSFEFNQTEGIVVDENANFRQLLGYLKEFFKKMGYDKIRFRPGYFAYTEPSVEMDIFHPKRKKWIELGGAGMFRPEVTIPIFGRAIPVLAWGPGFDRIIMEYFQITDLREMYKNDLNKLREMKFWMK